MTTLPASSPTGWSRSREIATLVGAASLDATAL
jgi:hypothetical protein